MECLFSLTGAPLAVCQICQAERARAEILKFLQFGYSFTLHAFRHVSACQTPVSEREAGIHLHRFASLPDCLVIPACLVINGYNLVLDRKRERVKFQCLFRFRHSFFRASNRAKVQRVPLVGGRKARVKSEGLLGLCRAVAIVSAAGCLWLVSRERHDAQRRSRRAQGFGN